MAGCTRTHHAIAIDGPAASGKSTIARILAERLGLIMVNTGEMYRAVTLAVVRRSIDPENSAAIAELLEGLDFTCSVTNRQSQVLLEGVPPGDELRSDTVNAAVSQVAAVPEVRKLLVAKQRELLRHGDVVMEGRDIGSVVFPETPFKIYVDASEEVRAQRRAAQGEVDVVAKRDQQDAARKTSPLIVPEGAAVIDTSEMDIAQALEAVMAVLTARGWFDRETIETP